jgi:hypothetical protein
MEDLEKSETIIVNGESVTIEAIQTLKGKTGLNDRFSFCFRIKLSVM